MSPGELRFGTRGVWHRLPLATAAGHHIAPPESKPNRGPPLHLPLPSERILQMPMVMKTTLQLNRFTRILLVATLGATTFMISGCERKPETASEKAERAMKDMGKGIEKATNNAKEAISDAAEAAKKEYEEHIEGELVKLDAKITSLAEKAKKSAGEQKDALEKKLANLKEERSDFDESLAKLKKSSATAWREMKDSMETALKSLQESVKKASE